MEVVIDSNGVTIDGEHFPLIKSIDIEQHYNEPIQIEAYFQNYVPATMAAIEYERLCAKLGIPSSIVRMGRD